MAVGVLADVASAINSLQARNSGVNIHAIELMGGGSRIPCIQNMVHQICGIEPSKSLNQSEANSTGCAFFAALERQLLNTDYQCRPVSTKKYILRFGKEER